MIDIACKLSVSGRGCHVAGIYVGVLMHADNLLLIPSTPSDLRKVTNMWGWDEANCAMKVSTAGRYTAVFSKPTVHNTVTLNTAIFFWNRYTAHPWDICGRWLGLCRYAEYGMGLAPLVTCPVCPVTDGIEPKMRPGPGWRSPAGPHFRQNPVALLLWSLQFWNLAYHHHAKSWWNY